MIKDFEFFHGVVFTSLLHSTHRALSLRSFSTSGNSAYVLDDSTGIYIKYCTKRLTPWNFTFKSEHQLEIDAMKENLGNVYLLLVCNDDGIVCLSYSELRQLLDETHDPIEWISVKRSKRQMYTVKGSNGKLDFKIGQKEFPEKLFRPTYALTMSHSQARLR